MASEHRRSRIVNMVAVAKVAPTIDLDSLAKNSSQFTREYRPFWRAVFRRGRHVAYVFGSGKVRLTGAHSTPDLDRFFGQVMMQLGKAGIRLDSATRPRVTNIVAVMDLEHPVDMRRLEGRQGEGIDYEPEQFPGAIIHLPATGVVALAFSSGKVVLSGVKRLPQLGEAEREACGIIDA